ncbi:SDR family NAD(P)-dependent oxidoreductase [Allonocardiopsis opalescens]|uniref:Short-subunit dehydrogenase n=1 Tax=Allonocardiopsis opalescens TaxID=1144618 RepID=A0A2T0QCC2_9ACTN|nr:SDR family NAD(P)-dependent oxidoreductase [Allonocardiopsis opalescens]PRY01548.1 short-subunit dehydrogenase [Allonocardiopsis opalescens]
MGDMRGRNVLVTGSTGGIGRQTARRLAEMGARVLLVGRDPGRAAEAARELRRGTGAPAEALTADVTRRTDLLELAERAADRCDGRLHVLVNNAGAVRELRELTEDGVEATFAANVLAPFTLTRALLPALRASGAGRVVNLAGGVPIGRIALDRLQGERRYTALSHYNQTKLALMAMSRVLAERLAPEGVTVNVAYPGHAYTEMNRGLTAAAYPAPVRPAVPLLRRLMPVLYGGAALVRASDSSVYLACDDGVAAVTGGYFDQRRRRVRWPRGTADPRVRAEVWRLCAELAPVESGPGAAAGA